MHDRLGEQVVETAIVAALGGRLVDLEQRFGFRPADGLVVDGGCRKNAGAPGGVIGVKRTGEMNAALRGGSFTGDHPIAHDIQRECRGVTAGDF